MKKMKRNKKKKEKKWLVIVGKKNVKRWEDLVAKLRVV